MKTDEELMKDYAQGSEEAFSCLYEKYSRVVYGFIIKRIRESEAEDLYQKVWRHLHEKRALYAGQPFAPWFFVMIRHLLIDEYRSLGRQNKKEILSELMLELASKEDDSIDVLELIQELPEDTQSLVKKYYLEGFSYEELEVESGVSQSGLRQRLSRAMRSLRKSL